MAWRRDGRTLAFVPPFPARAVTCSVWLGDGNLSSAGATFASNFASPPTQVVTNRAFAFPDHSALPLAIPAPFTAVVTFDVPFVYTGQQDLVWELRMTASVPAATFQMDVASSSGPSPTTYGGSTAIGNGCTTTNGRMQLRWSGATTVSAHELAWSLANGPTGTQVSVLVGAAATTTVPGLCEPLHTTGRWFAIPGTTNAAGTFVTPAGWSAPYDPTVVGFALTAQAVALDATQGALPFALSNGVTNVISDVGASPVLCRRVFASSTSNATNGNVTASFGLVTEFR